MSVVRRARLADVEALAVLASQTWLEMSLVDFAMPYRQEDIALFEAEKNSVTAISTRLTDPRQATWVIDDGTQLLGYADAGPCNLPHPNVMAFDMELNRLYVRRDSQKQGLGGRLMTAALEWMTVHSDGAQEWVGVWSGNEKAQRFYSKYGFEKVGEYDFPIGKSIDRDFILRRISHP